MARAATYRERQLAAAEEPVARSRLWFGIVAAPAAWTLAELVGYIIVSRDCGQWQTGLGAFAVPHSPIVVVGISIAMALISAAGLIVAMQSLRTVSRAPHRSSLRVQVESGVEIPRPMAPAPSWTRAHFMAMSGILVSGLLLINIVLFGIPVFLVNPCSVAR